MRLSFSAAALCLAPLMALADANTRLWDALQMDEAIEVLRAEYHDYGRSIGEAMLGEGGGGSAWQAIVARVVDSGKMRMRLEAELGEGLSKSELEAVLAFTESAPGQRLTSAEIAARRVLLNDGAEALALEAYGEAGAALKRRIEAFTEANDLRALNLQGALNSDVAFYRGLTEGGIFGMSEEEILSEVSERAEEVERELEDWLKAYLFLSFSDVPVKDIEAYTRFSSSQPGRALNRAIFEAYGALNLDLSYAFGLAVAIQMIGEEL